jgi:DNA polymerase-3 subunit chi
MTRIDFYILESSDTGKDLAVCRLAQKAFAQGHRIYIRTSDDAAAQRLDALLWTFNQGSFIPHAIHPSGDDNDYPVLIGRAEPPMQCRDVLIQLGAEPPADFERFQRVLEVVGPAEDDKQLGRQRFRVYRDKGCAPATHTL